MTFWFHCNKCYLTINSSNGAKYILTNCGHTYCNKCLTPGKNHCYICRTQCTIIELSPNLPPDIQMFFMDPDESSLKIAKVRDFQKNHCKRLIEHLVKKNKMLEYKYEHYKQYAAKLVKQNEIIQKDHQRLRNMFKMSKPTPGSGNPGNNSFQRTPTGQPTPVIATPDSSNASRFMLNRSSMNNQGQESFAMPSIYQATSSAASAASAASSGSRASIARGVGVPSGVGYPRPAGYSRPVRFNLPSPSPINLGKLSFGSAGRHQPSGSNRAP